MPSRIFIQRGISIGQDPQFSKMHFSWKCQPPALPYGHLPENLLSVPQLHRPFPACPIRARPDSGKGRAGDIASWQSRLCYPLWCPWQHSSPEEGSLEIGLLNRGGGKPGLAEDTLQAPRHYQPRSPEAWLHWSCPRHTLPRGSVYLLPTG